ncbi:MAG: helix-turn-helix transcriptional regulator [Oscillospiraceae bacterium]|nr:helix-turn-helix transcriptional regulator [Oscillospiraceae bacterium]
MDNENPVFRSLELIESRISEKLTVENIASAVFFSKYHYQRLFQEIVGDSVMEYVTKRKLTLAGRALLETNMAIIDIALDYGYDSREGFTRSFKAYMGVSPTEYRKYGLTAISQKSVKERMNMKYSKTTDEILRELNELLAKMKEAAEAARKCKVANYKPFWNCLADKTDGFADKIGVAIERTSAIADHPDEVTGRFNILKLIDDTAFHVHIMSLHVDLTLARAKPDDYQAMQIISEKYHELMEGYGPKIYKIIQFFNELSTLIFEDMRKTATEKIEEVIRRVRAAADMIKGYSYIKSELTYMAESIEAIPAGELTAKRLDDELFKLPILQFSIDTDIYRSGGRDKAMFGGMEPLKHSMEDAVDLLRSLPAPEAEEPKIIRIAKALDDIGYQGNILLFFTRGEAEKLGGLLNDRQKAAFDAICERISHYIHFTQNSADETAFKPIADRVSEIHKDMAAMADELGEYGGAVRVLADTFKMLGDKVMHCIKDADALSNE